MAYRALGLRFLSILVVVLLVVACGAIEDPGDQPEAPAELVVAREAALEYLRAGYLDAPASFLEWEQESPAEEGLPGWMESTFVSGDWTISVGGAVVAPEARRYIVVVSNPDREFRWEGRVDPNGAVAEGSETVLGVCDTVLAHIAQQYPGAGLNEGLSWTGGRTTPEWLVGGEDYEYTAGEWILTLSYPVVAPEATIYRVVVENTSGGFRWEGEVDAANQITEAAVSEGFHVDPVFVDRLAARDAAVSFVAESEGVPPVDAAAWVEDRLTAEGLVGAETYRYSHGSWVVEVRYPVVAPQNTIFEIGISNADLGIEWQGTVDSSGVVTAVTGG